MTDTHTPPISFDSPAALLELLYLRSALELDVVPDVPDLIAPPVRRASGPADAQDAWERRFAALVDQRDVRPASTSGLWHLLGDADEAAARRWVNSQRERIIGETLMPAGLHAQFFQRRASALAASAVDWVLVAPVQGVYRALLRPDVLLVSEAALLDDAQWSAT